MFGPTQTNLTPPPFIKVHVLSQEREQSCICMLVVSILSLFYDFAIFVFVFQLRIKNFFYVYCVFPANPKCPQQLQSFTEKSWNKRCSNRFKGCTLLCVHLYCYRFKRSPYMNHVPDCLLYLITISCCFLFTRHYITLRIRFRCWIVWKNPTRNAFQLERFRNAPELDTFKCTLRFETFSMYVWTHH